MKTIVTVVVSLFIASALSMRAADPKTNWADNCAQCHGAFTARGIPKWEND